MQRKTKQRKRREGATLIETLIVVPVFAIFLGGGHQIYQLSDARLKALHDARQAAWVATMDGCNTGSVAANWNVGKMLSDLWHALDEDGGDRELLSSDKDLLIELLGGEDTVISSASGVPGGKEEAVLMGCNETPHDLGTRRNALEWALELAKLNKGD